MKTDLPTHLLSLELESSIWDRFISVAPLALISTRNSDGSDDLFTTHRVLPISPANRFAFLASPAEASAANSLREGAFAVSFPTVRQVVEASLVISGGSIDSPLIDQIPTFPAQKIDTVLLAGASVFLECETDRVVEDLGDSSLIIGRVVAAHIDRDARRLADRDDQDLLTRHPLLAYVTPGRFAEIKDTDAFPAFG